MGRTGRALSASLVLVAALTACGSEAVVTVADEAPASPSASATASPTPTPLEGGSTDAAGGSAQEPAQEPSTAAPQPPSTRTPTTSPPDSGGPDLDGDGRTDSVTLTEVSGMGWSFDVRYGDGQESSAPLPVEHAVAGDVEVLGAVDLDRDGADEVLVRTLRAVGGQNAVVFRHDGPGVWLVRDLEGAPFELSTSGGMTGPRSYDCTGGEVRTRESERQADGTYRATTWRWTLRGHTAGPLGGARDDALKADAVSLDPSTCEV